ncbi:PepSY domain-containing protein [Oharaeibacter diazotrophicus]|uniref:NADPH--hemoprotein reductase n=1 Tax=Oharaeibacter diazotrophicus TaxID=1920512 RepID=A0A4R6RKQ4_9HYPH|nr:PepSY domain-containing protein [Oharaeibacter diazotrophicus]TDP86266.1 sulfite reductase (NADPH) flavoprotein alpha-component [Oharaeibacter diazotrophicus]BBE71793.1 bifunctional P-450/NADPH-P450 reductase [Pleomorphomonas sp. SM30]GLS78558.1 NADPH flavoprotein [Oharaeibacter diazotrophicus]
MFRKIHSIPGLAAALLVAVTAATGAVLSVQPALQRLEATVPARGEVTVAALAERVQAALPGVESIERKPSGLIVATWFDPDRPGMATIDPRTGAVTGAYEPSGTVRWITNLHRKLLADDTGRAVVGFGAAAMLLLTLSGTAMLAQRLGGWRRLFGPIRGSASGRLHAELGRAAVAGLVLSAATGLLLSATTFEFLPDGAPAEAAPAEASGGPALPVGELGALKAVDLADLRKLAFPDPGDPTDVVTLTTASGEATVDPATGAVLTAAENDAWQTASQWIYALHTGEGLWWLALVLGASSAVVPVLTGTGLVIWVARRRARPRIAHDAGAQSADTVILVGSEGNSTWGFAATLHAALTAAGHRVHTRAMNDVAVFRHARRVVVLTATYGDGEAPASARRFAERLARLPAAPAPAFAVLGFGDRGFAHYCGFAETVDAALAATGMARLLDLGRIDRQSAQAFSQWGADLGAALGIELALAHVPSRPRTSRLRLVAREDYGLAVDAPTAVLRFAPAEPGPSLHARLFGARLPSFEAGDLVGVLAPGSDVARFYSLASATRDGVLEICVRRHPGGLCSGFLNDLPVGGEIDAFVRANPGFRPAPGSAPVILVGAGTGIGPLAGFIRHNDHRRPMHLWFGARNPASDFLYRQDLDRWLAERRLTGLHTAFSRVATRTHVQDRLEADAETVRTLVAKGAQVMVCGGRDMAAGVAEVIGAALRPLGLTVEALKREGRYVEDVY